MIPSKLTGKDRRLLPEKSTLIGQRCSACQQRAPTASPRVRVAHMPYPPRWSWAGFLKPLTNAPRSFSEGLESRRQGYMIAAEEWPCPRRPPGGSLLPRASSPPNQPRPILEAALEAQADFRPRLGADHGHQRRIRASPRPGTAVALKLRANPMPSSGGPTVVIRTRADRCPQWTTPRRTSTEQLKAADHGFRHPCTKRGRSARRDLRKGRSLGSQ